jgi:hypothetical protein
MLIEPASNVSVGNPVVLPTILSLSNVPERDTSPAATQHTVVDAFPEKDATQVFDVKFAKIKFPDVISDAPGDVIINPTVELLEFVLTENLPDVALYPVTV